MRTIILSGGSGTRLWPLSRKHMPKQFLKLFNGKSLFQLTYERNKNISDDIAVFTNEDHYFLALDQISELNEKPSTFYLENIGKNTAAAITLSAMHCDSDEILFAIPADHLIECDGYIQAINKAKKVAQEGYIITFGISPTMPHTGYGYIECDVDGKIAYNVKQFHEKPDLQTAKKYIDQGNFFWNSGMFMFRAGVLLEEMKKHAPAIYETAFEVYKRKKVNDNIIRFDMNGFEDISIDYALMEKTDRLKLIKSDFQWSDLGSFDSLIEKIPSDEKIEIEANNNFLLKNSTLHKEVAFIGVEDLIVVDTPDALLITKKGESQKVKNLIDILKAKNPELVEFHTKVYRPWGSYEILVENNFYKIKRIIVQPGKRLSLQKHYHRSEHWVVVQGTALVQTGEKEYLVRTNESTYIKIGEVHRLTNPGKIPVILIEAQVGEYLEEDDIVRIEDDYKRSQL